MSVSDGQRANQTTFNNAFMSRTVNTSTLGTVGLSNTVDPLSGPVITNSQQAINQSFQNKNVYIHTATHTTLAWSAGSLSFTENILIKFPESSFVNTILVAGSPVALSDGQSAYVTLNRGASVNVLVIVATTIPTTKDTLRIASRVGSALIIWDGCLFRDGITAQVSDAGGVISVGILGDATIIEGNAKVEAGSNITLTRVGSTIKIDALGGGGGGGGVTYGEDTGSVTIKLKPTTETFVLQSPDLSKWDITIDNTGLLTAVSGSVGTVTNIKVTKPDASFASFAITNLGELQVVSPPPGGETLNDTFFISAPDGAAWRLIVNNSNELQTETDTTEANSFTVTNDKSVSLLKVQEVPGDKAIHYIPLLDVATLPAAPSVVAGSLPWAMYDNGANKRPIYYDSAAWRYFATDGLV